MGMAQEDERVCNGECVVGIIVVAFLVLFLPLIIDSAKPPGLPLLLLLVLALVLIWVRLSKATRDPDHN